MDKAETARRIVALVKVLEECADLNESEDVVKNGAFGYIICEIALFMRDDEYTTFVEMMETTRDRWIKSHPKETQ